MTASERGKPPNFFEDHPLDPVTAATRGVAPPAATPKKKAGFYLSKAVLERFNRHFHEMKLSGIPVENKSDLLEKVLRFALNDLEKGARSQLLPILKKAD